MLTLLPLATPRARGQEEPSDVRTARLAGADRTETAALVARAAFPDGADAAVVAQADDFPDALAAASLSGALGAPVLLTAGEELSPATERVLDDLGVELAVVLGGDQAVSRQVEARLDARGEVTRLGGSDRYGTAAEVTRAVVEASPVATVNETRTALVATGEDFPDALAGGAVAAGSPPRLLLLTMRDALPDVTREALAELRVGHVTVLGGTAAVSEDVVDDLMGLGVDRVDRVAGPTRLETALAVNRELRPETATAGGEVVLARGDQAADALAAAPYAARRRAPLLLVPSPDVLGATTAAELALRAAEPAAVDQVTAVGGHRAIAGGVLATARAALGGDPATRCAARVAAGMRQEERVGLLFMVGAPPGGLAEAERVIAAHHVGAVLLSGRWRDGAVQVEQAVARLRSHAPGERPLLVAADQEGGLVQALQGPGFSDIPRALEQGRLAPDELERRAATWGAELARAGVGLNLAPVLDTVPADRADSNSRSAASTGSTGRSRRPSPRRAPRSCAGCSPRGRT